MGEHDLPPIALSVRQPWAWAIVGGHKRIENRTRGAILSGGMDCRRIAIHAAKGLKEDEFHWGYWRLHRHGVACPHPLKLPRSAIIGICDVVDIIDKSDSEWFGGPCGLVLENATAIEPIPATGALGYFEWQRGGTFAPPAKWMRSFDRPNGDESTFSLFDHLEPSFKTDPSRPSRTKKA